MTYSIIGILAAIVLVIINRDVLWDRKGAEQTQRNYRYFLLGVLSYYITDMLSERSIRFIQHSHLY